MQLYLKQIRQKIKNNKTDRTKKNNNQKHVYNAFHNTSTLLLFFFYLFVFEKLFTVLSFQPEGSL